MRFTRLAFAALCFAALPATSLSAQPAPVVTDLMKDVDGVAQKFVALAKAMPLDKYGWRPAVGVRSVSEVLLHVASDNYLLPAMVGDMPPASTGINAKDFKTLATYEKRGVSREQTVADLEASFAHLKVRTTLLNVDDTVPPTWVPARRHPILARVAEFETFGSVRI